jgi:hypothetical protein
MFDSVKSLLKNKEKIYHAPIWLNSYIRRELKSIPMKKQLLMKTIVFNLTEKSRLTRFYNIHEGQSCWIIGNGPSLNKTKIMTLKDQLTFVVNGFTLHDKYEGLKPSYYVATNPRLMQSDFFQYHVMPKLEKTGITCFLNIEAKKRIGHPHENVYYILSTEIPSILEKRYNLDITRLLYGTKVSVIIQAVFPIAVYMGFKTIYLVGCDCDYPNFENGKHHFYKENITPNAKKLAAHSRKLYPDYYNNPEQTMKYLHSNFNYEYKLVSKYMDKLGVRVFNCTVGGKLEVFSRCRLEDVLKK